MSQHRRQRDPTTSNSAPPRAPAHEEWWLSAEANATIRMQQKAEKLRQRALDDELQAMVAASREADALAAEDAAQATHARWANEEKARHAAVKAQAKAEQDAIDAAVADMERRKTERKSRVAEEKRAQLMEELREIEEVEQRRLDALNVAAKERRQRLDAERRAAAYAEKQVLLDREAEEKRLQKEIKAEKKRKLDVEHRRLEAIAKASEEESAKKLLALEKEHLARADPSRSADRKERLRVAEAAEREAYLAEKRVQQELAVVVAQQRQVRDLKLRAKEERIRRTSCDTLEAMVVAKERREASLSPNKAQKKLLQAYLRYGVPEE